MTKSFKGDPEREDVANQETAAREMKISSLYIYVLAFFSGMCIMAVELCASRLMAPFFGTSTFVWTNIIGVIMIALSVGYFVGGKLADRKPRLHILLKLLMASSAFLLVLPFVASPFVRWLSTLMRNFNSSFSFIFFGSLSAITLLFSPPIVVMGMTSPFLIRIIARSGHVGDSAGRIFGISTIGSVLGTFLPILVFIPTLGTARRYSFAAVLFVVTALGFANRKAVLLCVAAAVPFLFPVPPMREIPGKVYSTESAYQYIEVFDIGSTRYLVYNDAAGFQTVANKRSVFTGLYYDYYSLLPLLLEAPPKSALIIGMGGGIIANQIYYFYPEIGIDAVEIDPKVIEIARTYFALVDTVRVFNQDGRIFVNLGKRKYDIVIIDAYTQQVYIPFHLTTMEFFNQVKRGLADNGIVAMNVSSAREDSQLIQSISNTLRLVFNHVYRLRIPGSVDNVVLASDRSIDFASLAGASGTELQGIAKYSQLNFRESTYDDRYKPLTDDKAPIEHMVDWEILKQLIKG
jgi:spermidine synthase